ncbi:MAG: ABC transporter permease, partial [Anaerolineae bacterium]|nr:ABC transporter permease [Anaerolineae bacterium]
GESSARIILVEILPNMMSIVAATFFNAVIYAIVAEAGLEFLGLGDFGVVSWGTILYWASNNAALLTGAWWTFVPPGLSIALVAFSLTMVNYAIDEITNPRLRAQKEMENALRKSRLFRHERSTPVIREQEVGFPTP